MSGVRNKILCLCVLLTFLFAVSACQKDAKVEVGRKKLVVVTTLFPLYDFARTIGGERAEVSLLLPPGVEPHHFEPRPSDVAKIENADLFIYTGPFMEPWADSLLEGIGRSKLIAINAGAGVKLMKTGELNAGEDGHRHGKKEEAGKIDPHIWLDFSNAVKMADNISAGFIAKDPEGENIYAANAEVCKERLRRMDEKYRTSLSGCRVRVIVHAGHFAFGYLAKRYGLGYVSVYPGATLDQEPTPRRMIDIAERIRRQGIRYIFYDDIISPKVAEVLSRETGTGRLSLKTAHNVSKGELETGATFLSLMERNLENLRVGLQCQ